jgi:hypothetical protein
VCGAAHTFDKDLSAAGLILRQKKEKDPISTLEVFVRAGQDTNEIRNRISRETGMTPAFYDDGTHILEAHRVNFDILKMKNMTKTLLPFLSHLSTLYFAICH